MWQVPSDIALIGDLQMRRPTTPVLFIKRRLVVHPAKEGGFASESTVKQPQTYKECHILAITQFHQGFTPP